MNEDEVFGTMSPAIRAGDTSTVEQVIKENPSRLEMVTPLGHWLEVAARRGRLPIVDLLIRLGADLRSQGGESLQAAAEEGHADVLKHLLEHGAVPDTSAPDKNPLFGAIVGRSVEAAKLLVASGIDVHVTYRRDNGELRNALGFAHLMGTKDIAAFLEEVGCRLPEQDLDSVQGKTEQQVGSVASDAESSHDQIISRISEEYGPVETFSLQEIVPVHDDVHVAVHVIRPNREHLHPYLTLFTTGMGDSAMHVPEGSGADEFKYAELIAHLPGDWPDPRDTEADSQSMWPFEWIRKIAYYPHLNRTWLGGPYTIMASDDPPTSLGPSTKQSCFLLVADFDQAGPIDLNDGRQVKLLSVAPIYTEERDIELKHGFRELITRLTDAGFGMGWDLNRKNAGIE